MNAMLQLLPFLALIAFQSVEITAQALGAPKYPAVVGASAVNGFDIAWTTTSQVVEPYDISTASGGGCTLAQIGTDSCPLPKIRWTDSDVPTITVTATLPAAADLPVVGGVPSKIAAYFCFSPPSAKNKKWRKINDVFKKDNSCKLSTILKKTDDVAYPSAGGAMKLGVFKLDPKVPTAFFTIRVYVSCADAESKAAKNEFCHVVNRWPAGDGAVTREAQDVFFPTQVMDSRPTKLYVAVFICAFIGPAIFLAFMIYERGFLAKQA